MTVYNDTVSAYITSLFAPEDDALRQVWNNTARYGLPAISVKPEEGRFLQFLVRALGVQKAVEIGTLGGYSGTWIARGLAPGGRLITLEKEPLHARVAQDNFARAGVAGQVEIRTGEAMRLLSELAAEGPFDFVFIDADKNSYMAYFDWGLEHVRLGGVIAAHNAFRRGEVIGKEAEDAGSAAIQALNRRVAAEPRLLSTIFPAGDGTLLAVKVA